MSKLVLISHGQLCEELKKSAEMIMGPRVLAEGGNFDLYAGMNLPMVISFLNAQMLDMKPDLLGDGKAGVVYINDIVKH